MEENDCGDYGGGGGDAGTVSDDEIVTVICKGKSSQSSEMR